VTTDRNAYTHIVTNPYVKSVQPVLNIVKLNDTQHESVNEYNVTDKPGLFGGDLEVDLRFRIGVPEDKSIRIGVEFGLLNTSIMTTQTYTYRGTTALGYLVEIPDLVFDVGDYQTLRGTAGFENFTINELKRRHPRYVKIFKKDFETDSALINSDAALAYIKENLKTDFRYPNSAMIGTVVDSENFDEIPDRSYDTKLLKAFVPENYEPLGRDGDDKRFNNSVEAFGDTKFASPKVLAKRSERAGASIFGRVLAIGGDFLAVAEEGWGDAGSTFTYGQIYIYDERGYGDFTKLKAGTSDRYSLRNFIDGGHQWADDSESVLNWNNNSTQRIKSITDVSLRENHIIYTDVTTVIVPMPLGGTPITVRTENEHRFQKPQPYNFGNKEFLYLDPFKSYRFSAYISASYLRGLNTNEPLVEQAAGFVIGGVYDFNSVEPDIVFATRTISDGLFYYNDASDILTIRNPYSRRLYLKIFAAQVNQILVNPIRTETQYVTQLLHFFYLGSQIPKYDYGAVIPDEMYVDTVRLVDLEYENIGALGEECIDINKDYLICDSLDTSPTAQSTFGGRGVDHAMLIAKKNEYGVWSKYFFNSTFTDGERRAIIDCKISKDQKIAIFVTHSGSSTKMGIRVVNLSNKSVTTFTEKSGIFIDKIVGEIDITLGNGSSANSDLVGLASPDNRTIILTKRSSRVEFLNTSRSMAGSLSFGLTMVYKLRGDQWSLDQVILPPRFTELSASDNSVCDSIGKWLVTGHAYTGGGPFGRNDGLVFLYKYNGKNYEFVKEFTPQVVRELTSGGSTFETPFPNQTQTSSRDERFGSTVSITLNKNNDPMIAVGAHNSAENPLDVGGANGRGAVYVILKHPQKEEFIVNIHRHTPTDDGINDRFVGYGGPKFSLAISEESLAFCREATSPSVDDRVEIVKIINKGSSNRIYEKDLFWSGMLQKKWTDNPAWIIYDLLTNYIHGAGAMVDAAEDVNVFNFYDVGRYFDSVDDDGFFLPLYDEKGQTEPRLSCNFLVKKDYNAFDLINAITDLFFGALYVENGKYNLWADRPTEPSWAFSNVDVVDGDFTYSEKYKQDRVTVVKVPFLDKHESFKKKIEYVEDSNLLREYGKIEKELEFTAFTSRSQARRYGKQFLYNNSYETEIVNFRTNDSALFLSPGNVIEISDQLRNFSTKKEIYSIESFNFEEKLHIVNESATDYSNYKIRYTEATITDGDVSNASYVHTDYDLTDIIDRPIRALDIKANSQGLPYILVMIDSVSSSQSILTVLKKNGNTFDKVDFLRDDFPDIVLRPESNVVIDSSDNVIIPFTVERNTYPEVGYFKYSGGDFTDTSSWSYNIITDDNTGFKSATVHSSSNRIVGQIDSSGFLYLLIRVVGIGSGSDSSKYILYKIDTSNNTSQKHEFGNEDTTNNSSFFFDMKLNNDKPAITYKKIGFSIYGLSIRYREFTGDTFTDANSYSDVFVWGSSSHDTYDRIELFFDADQNVYISHTLKGGSGEYDTKNIYFARPDHRFSNVEWETNRTLWNYENIKSRSPIVFLRNKSLLTFLGNVIEVERRSTYAATDYVKGLRIFQLKDVYQLDKPHKFIENIVYETDLTSSAAGNTEWSMPAVDHSFSVPNITLNNYDKHLYDNEFIIDVNKAANLMVSILEIESLQEAYEKLKFDNFAFQSEKILTDQKHFLDITGFSISGDFINLFPKQEKNTVDIFSSLGPKNSIAQVVDDTVQKKQYRVQNISEVDENLYQVKAKEFHSGKFDFIETYENTQESEQALFNIGEPANHINTPTPPLGVSFLSGIDHMGLGFVTGNITGAANGIETKYRVGVTYPNAQYVEKEFEKNINNLSASNEPITNFSFNNLPIFGEDYNLTFKSVKNPESSSFIEETFAIEDQGSIISANPFLNKVEIKSDDEQIKINVDVRNVFGRRMLLSSYNYYVTIKIQDEEILSKQRVDEFEFSLDQLKEFTQKLVREMKFKVELYHDDKMIDWLEKTIFDLPAEILSAEVLGGTDLFIIAKVKEFEKVRSIVVYANDEVIKTFFPTSRELVYSIPLYDFEISKLPVDEIIKFKIIAQDAFGDSNPFNFDGVIPGNTSAMQRYQDSISPIYSAHHWDQFSGNLSNFESSNNQTGFYGNGSKAICEISSSMVSGESGNIKLEVNSNNSNNEINLNFKNQGYLSQKTIINMSQDFYGVNILAESGVFEGFEFKVRKI